MKVDLTNFIIRTKLAQEVGGFDIELNHLQAGADGIFCEKVLRLKKDKLRIAKLPMALFVHN